MDWLTFALLASVFLFGFSLVGLVFQGVQDSRFAEKRTVKRRLLYMSAGGSHGKEKLSLYTKGAEADAGPLGRFLLTLPRVHALDRLLIQAKTRLTATAFVLLTLGLGLAGLLLGLRFLPQPGAAVPLAFGLAALPYLKLASAARAALRHFEEQLPEALDLLGRGMRSGHALTSAMAMVSEEMGDPIATEFGATVDQINFGLSPEEALENLCERVPSADLRFFTITVLVHKETGGNIAEVFDKISRLIRERLQFKNQVKAMTAEGRLSGVVLLLLPVALFAFLYLQNYEYVSLLWTERAGRILLGVAVTMQVTGWFVMRRMTQIEV
jgi:tight adherence protein B